MGNIMGSFSVYYIKDTYWIDKDGSNFPIKSSDKRKVPLKAASSDHTQAVILYRL
jgi:hypothetical protein